MKAKRDVVMRDLSPSSPLFSPKRLGLLGVSALVLACVGCLSRSENIERSKGLRMFKTKSSCLVAIIPSEILPLSQEEVLKLGPVFASPVQFYTPRSLKLGVAVSYVDCSNGSEFMLGEDRFFEIRRYVWSEEKDPICRVVFVCYLGGIDPYPSLGKEQKAPFFITVDIDASRASFGGIYNDKEELSRFLKEIEKYRQ